MKKRVLLIDESLTVQKVVALTLDKTRYSVAYAKSRTEAMAFVAESPPSLILVSDQVTDITVPSFPKEVEAWLGRHHKPPPIVLITGQDLKEMRHYTGVLKKPFSPQALQTLVQQHAGDVAPVPVEAPPPKEEKEEQALQARFNETFNDEAKLVRETFEAAEEDEPTLLNIPAPPVPEPVAPRTVARQQPAPAAVPEPLWGAVPPPPATVKRETRPQPAAASPVPPADILRGADNVAYKAALENEVEGRLEREDFSDVVASVLDRLLPPLVERLVQERLDRLLKDQEDFIELKP